MKAGTKLHLAMMVSACAALAGCETTGQQASSAGKSPRHVSGEARLAEPGIAVAALMLPQTPAETLYPVTVAYEPPVDPILAAEAVDPSQVPGAVPVPRPSPAAVALAMATPAMAAPGINPAMAATAGVPSAMAGTPGAVAPFDVAAAPPLPATPTVPGMAAPAGLPVAGAPVAVKGDRPGLPVTEVASVAPVAPYMLPENIAPQSIVPRRRPGDALGYASPAGSNAAMAAIDAGTSNAMRNTALATAPESAMRNEINAMVTRYSQEYGVPESLIHRVIHRESRYDSSAVHKSGRYWGLMQILPATARSMGYQGPANGLLDADTNLKYAIKYLRGAYLVADKDHDQAVRLYARGYYFDAKRKGMLNVLK